MGQWLASFLVAVLAKMAELWFKQRAQNASDTADQDAQVRKKDLDALDKINADRSALDADSSLRKRLRDRFRFGKASNND